VLWEEKYPKAGIAGSLNKRDFCKPQHTSTYLCYNFYAFRPVIKPVLFLPITAILVIAGRDAGPTS
jgi:hypothetical protein